MKSLFQRLLPGIFGDKSAPPATDPATQIQVVCPPDTHAPAAGITLPSIGARRPLISGQGEIAGFEFRIGDDILRRTSRRADDSAKTAHARAVLSSALLLAHSGRIGLARLPANVLTHAVVGLENSSGIWIGLDQPDDEPFDPEQLPALVQTITHLRSQGAKLAWAGALSLALVPDFLLLSQGSQSMPSVLEALFSRSGALENLPTLVTDITTFGDLEQALHSGVNYVCGALATTATSDVKESLPILPEVGRIGSLLNQLLTGAENDVIVEGIKSDVSLSLRLLQRINSAGFARLNAGASIDQAVLLLGRSELYRWLSLLLFQFAGKRRTASALQEVALWRSRLLELLAQENHEESPSQLFTLGLASMMGPILNISLHDVLTILHLHPQAQQALLERIGPWHIYLQLARQVEAQSLDDDNPLVVQFGGAEHIHALSDAAWDWAWAAMHHPAKSGQ